MISFKKLFAIICLTFLLFFISLKNHAQIIDLNNSQKELISNIQNNKNIELKITLTTGDRVLMRESIAVLVRVENLSSKNTLTLQSIDVDALPPLKKAYPSKCLKENFETISILPGDSRSISCELKPNIEARNIFLINRQNEFHLLVTSKLASKSDSNQFLHPIKIYKPETDVIFGSIIGVILLSVFLAIHGIRTDSNLQIAGFKIESNRFFIFIKYLLLDTISGAITAIFLLALTHSSKSSAAPINISVEDFWGGLVIGIFSIPLSKWIVQKVQTFEPVNEKIG